MASTIEEELPSYCGEGHEVCQSFIGEKEKPEAVQLPEISRCNFNPWAPEDRGSLELARHALLARLKSVFWPNYDNGREVESEHFRTYSTAQAVVLYAKDKGNMFSAKLGVESEDKNFILTTSLVNSMHLQLICKLSKSQHKNKQSASYEKICIMADSKSSQFGNILHCCSTNSPERLVKENMGYFSPIPSTPAIRMGKNNEKFARSAYFKLMAGSGQSVEWCPCGLHLYPEKTFLGASSDGIVIYESDRMVQAALKSSACTASSLHLFFPSLHER